MGHSRTSYAGAPAQRRKLRTPQASVCGAEVFCLTTEGTESTEENQGHNRSAPVHC
jgi:hypothetical protein